MFGFIYITTNLITNKKYLGQCRYGKKNSNTYLGSGKTLKLAIKKYGKSNFKREIIFEASTRKELTEAEILYIKQYDCVKSPDWYNIAEGGYTTRGFTGKIHKKSSNELRSKALIGRPRPQSVKDALSKAHLGKIVSQETRLKHSLSISGSKHHRAIKITINNVTYDTITEARNKSGLSLYAIRKLIIRI